MLTHKTLKIIFEVLLKIRQYYVGGERLIKAYRKAIRTVASQNKIFYQTVADGCCRRLNLNRDGFLDLVRAWLAQDSDELIKHLKTCVN